MKIPEIDLANPDYAEAIFRFCNDDEWIDDNDKRILIYDDISFAEFVQKYKYREFCLWYMLNYV